MKRAIAVLAMQAAALFITPVRADETVRTLTEQGPNGEFHISRPVTLSDHAHPLAVFSVGTNGKPENGRALFESLASLGIVVIAGTDPDQGEGDQAMLGIEWLIEQNAVAGSPYYGKLITSRVMAFGLSQGGNAALWTAIRENRIAANTITSVVALAPGAKPEQADTAPVSELAVPVLYIAGGTDVIVPPARVRDLYDDNVSEAWYVVKKGVGHLALLTNQHVGDVIRAWAMAHLYGDVSAGSEFYGAPWGLASDDYFRAQVRNF